MSSDQPAAPRSVEELEEHLSEPPASLVEAFARLEGDLTLLGVGGKMGPTMARMARRASDRAGVHRRVIGVSRFGSGEVRRRLEAGGVETIACDLLDESAVAKLPQTRHVVFMSGFKFGADDQPALTWAMNCYAPAVVCRHFRDSRWVAFSTGNVYGLTPVERGGSLETDALSPVGEYAMSALGRERIFQYFSDRQDSPLTLLRLNYATELRYGVLVDIALAVRQQEVIDLGMSHVNVIWLRDANSMTLRALLLDHNGSRTINLAGPEILRVRDLAQRFGDLLGVAPRFDGRETGLALLNNGSGGYADLGRPDVDADAMTDWTADWVGRGGELLGKPTHFEVRDGKF